MSLSADQGQVVLQLPFIAGLSATEQQTLQAETTAKISRMDTTGVNANWTFPIGSQDPTTAEMVQKVTACLAQLQGDENAVAYAAAPSAPPYYCILGDVIICYTPVTIYRAAPSTDALWGGGNGAGTPIAIASGGLAFAMEAVYAFARAIAP